MKRTFAGRTYKVSFRGEHLGEETLRWITAVERWHVCTPLQLHAEYRGSAARDGSGERD